MGEDLDENNILQNNLQNNMPEKPLQEHNNLGLVINPINTTPIVPDPVQEHSPSNPLTEQTVSPLKLDNAQIPSKPKSKILRWVFSIIFLAIIGVGGYVYWQKIFIFDSSDSIKLNAESDKQLGGATPTANVNDSVKPSVQSNAQLDSATSAKVGGQSWTANYPNAWTIRTTPYFGLGIDINYNPAAYSRIGISVNLLASSNSAFPDYKSADNYTIIDIQKYVLPNLPGQTLYQVVSKWVYNSSTAYEYYIVVGSSNLNASIGSKASDVVLNAGFMSKNGSKLWMYIYFHPTSSIITSEEVAINLLKIDGYKTAVDILKSVKSD